MHHLVKELVEAEKFPCVDSFGACELRGGVELLWHSFPWLDQHCCTGCGLDHKGSSSASEKPRAVYFGVGIVYHGLLRRWSRTIVMTLSLGVRQLAC